MLGQSPPRFKVFLVEIGIGIASCSWLLWLQISIHFGSLPCFCPTCFSLFLSMFIFLSISFFIYLSFFEFIYLPTYYCFLASYHRVHLSMCVPFYLFLYLPLHLSLFRFVNLSAFQCLSVCPLICLFNCIFTVLSFYVPLCLSTYLLFYLLFYISLCLPIYIFVYRLFCSTFPCLTCSIFFAGCCPSLSLHVFYHLSCSWSLMIYLPAIYRSIDLSTCTSCNMSLLSSVPPIKIYFDIFRLSNHILLFFSLSVYVSFFLSIHLSLCDCLISFLLIYVSIYLIYLVTTCSQGKRC
jgi:hypothetical protein